MHEEEEQGFDCLGCQFAGDGDPSLPNKALNPYFNIELPQSSELFKQEVDQDPELLQLSATHKNSRVDECLQPFDVDIYLNRDRICSYNEETRREKLERYRLKKANRIWKKKVAYVCRRDVANHRPRVKGRFVSKKNTCKADPEQEGQKQSILGEPAAIECKLQKIQ